jgi:hypothetical protein
MSPLVLRRIAIGGAILTVLLAIDGLYMVFANYHPDDTSNNGFGAFHPSDGQTLLIAAALLLVITVVAFILAARATPVRSERIAKNDGETGVEA